MFPAYAGVILRLIVAHNQSISVPRVCGGDPLAAGTASDLTMVFPAYAGVILQEAINKALADSVPRVCGGDPDIVKFLF